jgi:RNA polymerase sigma-70 factor (ECF subfamily)
MVASTDLSELEPAAAWDPAAPLSGVAPSVDKQTEFRALYEAHFKLVWGSLRRFGVPEADAMDLTQKVFFTVYTKLDEFEGRSLLTTWLVSICQRVASDYRRSAVVRREIATEAGELEARPALESNSELCAPNANLTRRDNLALAEAILNKLPEDQRSVFVLYELEELSGPEIAEVLKLSVGTVRSRLRLAREIFAREVKRLAAAESGTEEKP